MACFADTGLESAFGALAEAGSDLGVCFIEGIVQKG